MEEKTLADYIKVARILKTSTKNKKLKIALSSDFTIKGLSDVLKVKCNQIGVDANVFETDYNQIDQEILNTKSDLAKFEPEITFILIDQKYVFGEDFIQFVQSKKEDRMAFIKERSEEILQLIHTFTKNISGLLVFSNLRNVSYTPFGINEEKCEFSIKDMIMYFNKELKKEFIKDNQVFVYDFSSFFVKHGENNIINPKLYLLADLLINLNHLPLLANELMSYIKPLSSKNKKCIVLDLDNTLWGGIVGEDGFDNIQLDNKAPGNVFFNFQKKLLELHKRGIILAINSKNNHADAIKVIREHPYMVLREKNFASLKINWEDKATNLKEIAKDINIGLDSIVFIDDDPFNRALIKEVLPEVLVIDLPKEPSMYVKTLEEINDFNTLQITEEDFKKGEIYHQQKQRNELKKSVTDINAYLKTLKLEIEFIKANSFTIPRISQLTNKTNQFNLTTKRYTENDIKKFSESLDHLVYAITVKDKFGDNGLTGVFIIDKKTKDTWLIDTFLLSCRIIGRNIETAMLNYIKTLADKENIKELIGEYIPSKKNVQTAKIYEKNGFSKLANTKFILKNPKPQEDIEYIKIIDGEK